MKKPSSTFARFSLISIFVCLLSVFAAGQYLPFRFERFGIDNGLSNQIVTCTLRDRSGYLWVGTENGLNRFDGYVFKAFLPEAHNKTSLQDGNITNLFEDQKGNLWVGTKAGGLHVFDRRAETFRAFRRAKKDAEGLSDDRITRIYEDKDGSLWIGTPGGLDKLTWEGAVPDAVHITSFKNDPKNPESLSHNRVTSMMRDRNGTFWVGTKEGLNRMTSENPARFERFTHDKAVPTSLPDNEIYSLLSDTDGNLWIGMWGTGGLSRISAAELSKPQPVFLKYPYDEKTKTGFSLDIVLNLLEDSRQNIWLSTGEDENLVYLSHDERDKPNPHFVNFIGDDGNPFGLPAASPILSASEDNQGILWIAATSGGLSKLDLSKSAFKLYRHNPGKEASLLENYVNNIYEEADGSIWASSDMGITRIVPGADAFSQPSYTTYKSGLDSKDGLEGEGIATMLVDSKNRLWVGTVNGGLKLRRQNGKQTGFETFKKDPQNPQSLGNNAVLTLFEDFQGNVWIGTYQGLYKAVEPTAENPKITFVSYRSKRDDPTTLSSDIIESLTAEKDGTIWVGTVSGLNRLDPATGQVTRFASDTENPHSLNNEMVNNLMTSSKGVVWVGTKGGLCRFNPETQSFDRAGAETGLETLGISAINEDADGNLWVATINGLFRFNPETNESRHFSKSDGLPSDIFNRNASSKGKNGVLYFGSTQGFIAFNPQDVKPNTIAPPIVLTEFYLANQAQGIHADSILPSHIQFLNQIVLTHTDNIFGIEFSALNYKQPENNRYAYKLEGFSNDWIETDAKNRRATFTNLNPGEYTFRVKAANNDGVWNSEGASLKVIVLPPWWKTWWAQTLLYSFIIICLLAVPFIRLRMLKKQRAFLENQVVERTSELSEANHKLEDANRAKSVFLSNMSHELRTPLNAVIGFAQLLGRDSRLTLEQNESLGVIRRSGEHLLSLINDVLSISKIEAGKLILTEQVFSPRKMLLAVEEMLRVRADAKNLTLQFEIEPGLPPLVKGDDNKLKQVLINLLGNAVKFTESGGVVLRCTWNPKGRMRFEVEDTGFGIAENEVEHLFEAFQQTESGQRAKEGTGLGLVISQEIVHLMGGQITVKSRLNEGTVFSFEVNLPAADETERPAEKLHVIGLAEGERTRRILVVDDTLENRMLLSKLLFSIGFDVREAANGRDAFEIWSDWRPDLIFMDLRMPVLDGYEATKKIRIAEARLKSENRLEAEFHTKIVALTASAFESERGTVITLGADDFLSKPFRQETIFDNLAKHLGVQYRYESDDNYDDVIEIHPDSNPASLTPERFTVIDPELLTEFERALRLGDDVAARRLTDEIRHVDPVLAATIDQKVKNFDFDLVLHAMGRD